jgi:archaellum component FlaC
MKKSIFILMFIFSSIALFAQKSEMPPDSKPDAELTRKEADLRIQDFQARIADLEAKLSKTQGDVADLKKQLEDTKKAYMDCQESLLKLVGANSQDLDAFRQKLGVLEAKVRDMKRLTDDQLADRRSEVEELEKQLNELRRNKISIMQEFYPKIIALAKDIRSLYKEKKIKSYTVGTWAENKDCLWNISGRMEILGDPFMWPKLWQNNSEIIRNPDLIYPGQVLNLPEKGPKTTEEMKAERKYWRKKHAVAASETKAKTGE